MSLIILQFCDVDVQMQWGCMFNFFNNILKYTIFKLKIIFDVRCQSFYWLNSIIHFDLVMSNSELIMDSHNFNAAYHVLNFDSHSLKINTTNRWMINN